MKKIIHRHISKIVFSELTAIKWKWIVGADFIRFEVKNCLMIQHSTMFCKTFLKHSDLLQQDMKNILWINTIKHNNPPVPLIPSTSVIVATDIKLSPGLQELLEFRLLIIRSSSSSYNRSIACNSVSSAWLAILKIFNIYSTIQTYWKNNYILLY